MHRERMLHTIGIGGGGRGARIDVALSGRAAGTQGRSDGSDGPQVINGAPASAGSEPSAAAAAPGESRRRGASSPPPAAPEKRKWVAHAHPPAPYLDADELAARAPSSDDDDTKVRPANRSTSCALPFVCG